MNFSEDDFFGDQETSSSGYDTAYPDALATATTNKVSRMLYNDGYRIGREKAEEKSMQDGFDEGFTEGMILGRACGNLLAKCRYYVEINSSDRTQLSMLENLALYLSSRFIDEWRQDHQLALDNLSEKISSISSDLSPILNEFISASLITNYV
jgi:flagellar biosynthesis/type III secretory pathway protein FliH